MWLFANHEYDHGGQILRWTFLFAAPIIFEKYDSDIISFVHLFIGVAVLTFVTLVANFLTYLTRKDILNEQVWAVYGRTINFLAVLMYNSMIATQIWTGYVISNLIMDIFSQHNSILVLGLFTAALIFLLGVIQSTTDAVENLR